VNFADGRQPAPAFDRSVTVVVDGRQQTLTQEAASDRSAWSGSPVNLYRLLDSYTLREGSRSTPPRLEMHIDSGDDFVCGRQQLPPRFRNRQSLWLGLIPPGPGPARPCTFLNVFLSAGRISAVVVRTPAPLGTHNPHPAARSSHTGAVAWSARPCRAQSGSARPDLPHRARPVRVARRR
jgi:hypothetical protein